MAAFVSGDFFMSNRRCLVTGGGFIGSDLIRQLQENGATVRVLEYRMYLCLLM